MDILLIVGFVSKKRPGFSPADVKVRLRKVGVIEGFSLQENSAAGFCTQQLRVLESQISPLHSLDSGNLMPMIGAVQQSDSRVITEARETLRVWFDEPISDDVDPESPDSFEPLKNPRFELKIFDSLGKLKRHLCDSQNMMPEVFDDDVRRVLKLLVKEGTALLIERTKIRPPSGVGQNMDILQSPGAIATFQISSEDWSRPEYKSQEENLYFEFVRLYMNKQYLQDRDIDAKGRAILSDLENYMKPELKQRLIDDFCAITLNKAKIHTNCFTPDDLRCTFWEIEKHLKHCENLPELENFKASLPSMMEPLFNKKNPKQNKKKPATTQQPSPQVMEQLGAHRLLEHFLRISSASRDRNPFHFATSRVVNKPSVILGYTSIRIGIATPYKDKYLKIGEFLHHVSETGVNSWPIAHSEGQPMILPSNHDAHGLNNQPDHEKESITVRSSQSLIVVSKDKNHKTLTVYDTMVGSKIPERNIQNPPAQGDWKSAIAFSKDLLILIYSAKTYKAGGTDSPFHVRLWRLTDQQTDGEFVDVPILAGNSDVTPMATTYTDFLPRTSVFCAAFRRSANDTVLACWHVNKNTLQLTQIGYSCLKYPSLKVISVYDATSIVDAEPSFYEAKGRIFCLWIRPRQWRVYCLHNQQFIPVSLGGRIRRLSTRRDPPIFGIPSATNRAKFSLCCVSPLPSEDSDAPQKFQVYRLMLKW